jgi:hypothetical protein
VNRCEEKFVDRESPMPAPTHSLAAWNSADDLLIANAISSTANSAFMLVKRLPALVPVSSTTMVSVQFRSLQQ